MITYLIQADRTTTEQAKQVETLQQDDAYLILQPIVDSHAREQTQRDCAGI